MATTKIYRRNGINNIKDTIVIINNVTVSFLCLFTAPWCWGYAPHKNLIEIQAYETQITNRQKQYYIGQRMNKLSVKS